MSNYTTGTDRKRFERHGAQIIAKPKHPGQYQLFQLQSYRQHQHSDPGIRLGPNALS